MSGTIKDIHDAAKLLREGGVVAFPTETVYGLGADAFNERAIAQVFTLKGRPSTNPLIVHVSGPEMARQVVGEWTEDAERLAREFWPGPLSIILPRCDNLPAIVTGGSAFVAVRCPMHPTALALLFEFDGPLVGPSANPSGEVSPTTAEHVRAAFPDADLTILEGGPCTGGIESTVLSLADRASPRILRPGLIGAAEVASVLGRGVETGSETHSGTAPMPSPGMLGRHYAPRTPARLFDPHQWPRVLGERTEPAVVISHRLREIGPPHAIIPMPTTPEAYAAALYTALREADTFGAAEILIERPPTDGPIWFAIADRLRRATTP